MKLQIICCTIVLSREMFNFQFLFGISFFQLYFDLEYKTALNPLINGQKMLKQFKDFVKHDLLKTSFPTLIDKLQILDLNSSTEEKFSHHLIVNMYYKSEPVLFANNLQVGHYVRKLISRLKEENSKEEKFPLLVDGKVFVDEAVYSKNRNFRTFLSTKYGKNAVLKKAFDPDESICEEEEFFLKVSNTVLIIYLVHFFF